MWIVRIALARPYTFVVLAQLILILAPIVILRTPTDIFPNIDIPVIAAAFNYTGLSAEEMEERITSIYERSLTTTVNDIEHLESQSIDGRAIVKVFFQPGADINAAVGQVSAISQPVLRQMPPGTTAPFLLTYNASSVPIIQLGLSGRGMSEQALFDYGVNFIRTRLVTINGCAIPYPYGGRQRQIMVDIDPAQMQAKGLSPADITNAIANQNLILPAGTSKIGQFEYDVDLNEQIGIAKAAFFPTLQLTATGGFEGGSLVNWLGWPSRFWAVGPQMLQTIFDAGRRRAQSESALAYYDEAVANYRQSALTAFQQVEDNLATLRVLEEQAAAQRVAVEAAQQSLALSLNRYKGGLVTYLEVVTAQSTALQNESTDVDILRRRMDASVLLIKALGGGWDVTKLPS